MGGPCRHAGRRPTAPALPPGQGDRRVVGRERDDRDPGDPGRLRQVGTGRRRRLGVGGRRTMVLAHRTRPQHGAPQRVGAGERSAGDCAPRSGRRRPAHTRRERSTRLDERRLPRTGTQSSEPDDPLRRARRSRARRRSHSSRRAARGRGGDRSRRGDRVRRGDPLAGDTAPLADRAPRHRSQPPRPSGDPDPAHLSSGRP